MEKLTVGIQLTDEGVEFFGLEEVNAAIQAGRKVTKINEGDVLVEEDEETTEGDEDSLALVGFMLEVEVE